MTQKERAQKVEEAIRLVWDSLESHLPYTYETPKDGTKKFHQDCVKEYATLLKVISELY